MKKGPAGELVLFSGEGISFLMGCSKNYIMYWGVYDYYIYTITHTKVFTNLKEI